ncbi:growth arrest and DNA damage-inducible proteins-interacting protein 1 [Thamnophis elegans]|uniref:growth arrest and DNA damage-inducible proteins-interacting protein 1 n=1 Tax=Thamnophis elegans TaxID=35005 RepID=UPI00137724E3|nr:growth arrest and DNA damage-inducible proteins-interacting protein 1 [Thamnophis elegans]
MAARGSRLLLGGVRLYNAKPLKLQLKGIYRPNAADPAAPAWQLTAEYEAKLFGRHGRASGVDPSRLWPSLEKLQEMEAEEKAWYPSLKEMQQSLEAKEKEAEAQQRQKEEIIAAKMAKMPQMIEEWQREKQKRKLKEQQEKERRRLLLAEAREQYGYHLDHHSPEFQEMVMEREKMKRMEQKEEKKRMRGIQAKKAMESKILASSPDNQEEMAEQKDI